MILKATFRRPARQDLDLSKLPGAMPPLVEPEAPRLRRGGLDREAQRDAREDQGHHPGDALSGLVRADADLGQHRDRRRQPHLRRRARRRRCVDHDRATASSSRCSGPPAAARPRCCAWSPASASSKRAHPVRREAHRHAAAAQAQHRHGVPELRHLSQPDRRRQCRLRPAGAQSGAQRIDARASRAR